jgi:hypothetical protein
MTPTGHATDVVRAESERGSGDRHASLFEKDRHPHQHRDKHEVIDEEGDPLGYISRFGRGRDDETTTAATHGKAAGRGPS